jgi:PAS domain S-box-containing protein
VADAAHILVVDADPETCQVVRDLLEPAGHTLSFRSAPTDQAAGLAWLPQQRPDLMLIDLETPGADGAGLVRQIRKQRHLEGLPIVALTSADADPEIDRAYACGADDFITKPLGRAALLGRVRSQLDVSVHARKLARRERELQTAVDITQALASTLDIRDILLSVTRRVAELVRVERCSIVLAEESSPVGFVVASSDDPTLRDLPIRLSAYPEIREVLSTRSPLIIRNTASHPLLEFATRGDRKLAFQSLALVPIVHEGRPMGVIFLRSRHDAAFPDDEMSLVVTVANTTAIALRNARVLQALRDQSRENVEAREQAEHRVQLFQRYVDFFESAADGIVVMDQAGHVLFANPRARDITGLSETDLADVNIAEILSLQDRRRAVRLIRGFREGVYPQGVDVRVARADGADVILSLNFSSVLREEGAVLCTFRDVTTERKTEIELKQTKEFFERVIDSSVDAIVSAGLDGRVLLFNRAASRVFGYEPRDVVGRMSVEKLYPPGVAREVMRRIRDPNVNGPGRLEDYRVDMIDASGENLAVTLSAALIMEDGHPIGSVGIFTDIREKLRMEARLVEAQEELREREKQAAVAELAGATAHELNQPLTSVMGYAQMISRRLEDTSPLRNAADVIVTQSERMAEIVRKIGKITRYETMSYVGGAKILDLDKATSTGREGETVRR